MKLIIDIEERSYEIAMYRKNKFPRDLTRFETIIINGKPLPKNPTNGDVIKAIFPKYYQTILGYFDNTRWWNSPYKEEDDV